MTADYTADFAANLHGEANKPNLPVAALANFVANCHRMLTKSEEKCTEIPEHGMFCDENSNELVAVTTVDSDVVEKELLGAFSNISADDHEEIYPVTVSEIAESQRMDAKLKHYF